MKQAGGEGEHESSTEITYVCPNSGTALKSTDDGNFLTSTSGRSYPVVEGIPILVFRPESLLRAFVHSLDANRTAFEREKSHLRTLARGKCSRGVAARIERMLQGKEMNLSLLEKHLATVRAHVSEQPTPPNIVDQLATTAAHRNPCWWMLSYFYQDWGNTQDFRAVSSLIREAAIRFQPDRGRLLVLGAGAAGLARDCAKEFDCTYGIDHCLPSLLMAKAMLSGQALELSLENADWATIELTPPQQGSPHVDLAIADVNWLPFAARSASIVITQYLMDVLGDPLHVVSEIRRVLKPGGVWINFSIPFAVPGEPTAIGRPRIDEIPELLSPKRWTVEESSSQRFSWLNTDALAPVGHRTMHEVHYFVARRLPAPADTQLPGGPRICWDWVPRRVPSRQLAFVHRRVVDAEKIESTIEAQMQQFGSLPLTPQWADFFIQLLLLVDGRRSIRDIFDALPTEHRGVGEDTFLQLFPYLFRHLGLLCA